MRTPGIIAIGIGIIFLGAVAAFALDGGGDGESPAANVAAEEPAVTEDSQDVKLRSVPDNSKFASDLEDSLDLLSDSISARAADAGRIAEQASAAKAGDSAGGGGGGAADDGCETEHASGDGWSSTSVVCNTQTIERDGDSVSISSSNVSVTNSSSSN